MQYQKGIIQLTCFQKRKTNNMNYLIKEIGRLILVLIWISCQQKKKLDLNDYISTIKQTNFHKKYKGYQNTYRRNCIFSFISPESSELIYTINPYGNVEVINASKCIDTSASIKRIKDLWISQNKYKIFSFSSNKNQFAIHFDLSNLKLDSLSNTQFNGVLIYYYVDFYKDERLLRIHESLRPKSVGDGWYFYLSKISNDAEECNLYP